MFKYFDSFVMPVGISFYTFVGIGYVIDVYRKEIRAERNILKYGLFVSFFPQLVSGPIERSNNLLLQIQEGRERQRLEYQKIIEGLILMLWGYFQKIVIADRAAVLVNTVYAGYEEYQMVPLATAAIVYGLQIYCDFSGYSTIAIGAAKVLGFDLIENFNTPYFAKSIVDFWHRWHLSLTSWFTDYVYIPLGGNRCSKGKKYCNILLTFGVSGIWHGANLTFVIWGILHGLFQIIEKELSPIINRINKFFHTRTESFGYHFFQVITTFILVNIAWIFFERKLCEMLFIT